MQSYALKYNSFTSFKQRWYAYFSSFARATQYSIGLEPVFSLGRCIPPTFALHFQAVLLFQRICYWTTRISLSMSARSGAAYPNSIARLQLLADYGPALTSSLAATSVISV